MTTIVRKMSGLLIDLDGTIYHGSKRIEHADKLIADLRTGGLAYKYVTNNSSATPEDVADRLKAMGIEAYADDVCTSAQAAATYIAEKLPGASVFVIGEKGLREAVVRAGLTITEDNPDYVLQGIDREFNYSRLAKAVRYILDGASYVMTNPDLLLPTENGLQPGAGSIGASLTAAGGKQPVVIGKPSAILMNYSLNRLGRTAADTWVIGDNMATDIAAGHASGCGTILVLTGLTRSDNYEYYAEIACCKPDVICTRLDELRSYISTYRGI
ncbi:TIGR01457 family HAD-type hydrolase [Paenibacillus harenae]|uniref:Acid sugar phosphatase n=1 Tax=Paenibacillus harenae TaxID=306543 RepID=A0ABT9TVI3_PAEHA|nr:TIGR01457 family HAD-type hydrolase [Paenibacillus harenae]MDQ0111373.1 4-nitrophenyl phosphatase [Paenibacillus harenae]